MDRPRDIDTRLTALEAQVRRWQWLTATGWVVAAAVIVWIVRQPPEVSTVYRDGASQMQLDADGLVFSYQGERYAALDMHGLHLENPALDVPGEKTTTRYRHDGLVVRHQTQLGDGMTIVSPDSVSVQDPRAHQVALLTLLGPSILLSQGHQERHIYVDRDSTQPPPP